MVVISRAKPLEVERKLRSPETSTQVCWMTDAAFRLGEDLFTAAAAPGNLADAADGD